MRDYTIIKMTDIRVETFPDGETNIFVPQVGHEKHVVLVGSCHSAQASETFLAAAYEIAQQGPASFTVLITYFRNARSERRTQSLADRRLGKPVQAVMAKMQARLWSGLGNVYPGVKLVLLDPHTDLILNYFEGPVHVDGRSCLVSLHEMARTRWVGLKDPVYATVDAGGVHRVRDLAEQARVGFAHIDKKRLSGTVTEVREVHGDVEGRDVIIFDDMISTGGSLVKAAAAYKERGAQRVYAVATHGVFANNAIQNLVGSVIESVIVTDSHPNAEQAQVEAPEGFLRIHHLDPRFLV